MYLGATSSETPLASGELRRQIGIKLRSQDTCNVIYVMWHIAPKPGIEVSVKSNAGMHEHEQCRDHGYAFLRPTFRELNLRAIKAGLWRVLRASIHAEEIRVSVDGQLAWRGALPPQAFSFDGPVGLRTDNGKFDVDFLACPKGEDEI
jgi:hypothetical protein